MTTKEVLTKLKKEEGISFLKSKRTDKEAYDFLVSKGLTDSFNTFVSESKKVFEEKFSKMSAEEILKEIEGAELTDKELEMIAGGKGQNKTEDAYNLALAAML